jgi:hypothetical protein
LFILSAVARAKFLHCSCHVAGLLLLRQLLRARFCTLSAVECGLLIDRQLLHARFFQQLSADFFVYLQFLYISAMDEPVLSAKFMTRNLLWPEQDVNKIAAWM